MPSAVGIIAGSRKPVSSFSPLSIPWHSAFWASDPSWTPPADGGAVSSWKNSGTSAANATQATGADQPVYRASYANLNSKPVVDFDSDCMSAAISPSIPQPNHIFVVGTRVAGGPVVDTICDGQSTTRHLLQNRGEGSYISIYAGTSINNSTAGKNTFAIAALFNGASTVVRVNGTVITSGNPGAQSLGTNLWIGSGTGGDVNRHKGAIAFLGVSDTELTAQQITDLETWAKNYYGVPIP